MNDFIKSLLIIAVCFYLLFNYYNNQPIGTDVGKVGEFMREVKQVYEFNKRNEQK
jgi:hypothetical protein